MLAYEYEINTLFYNNENISSMWYSCTYICNLFNLYKLANKYSTNHA